MNKKEFLKFCIYFYSGMGIISLLLVYWFNYWNYFKIDDNYLLGISYTSTIIFLSTLISFCTLKLKSGKKMVIEFKNMLPKLNKVEKFIVAFFSGIGEELLFRGFLLSLVGLTISSFIFGLIHFPMKKHMRIWSFFALVMGFLLGVLCEMTGSVLYPILAHIIINFIGFNIISSFDKEKK